MIKKFIKLIYSPVKLARVLARPVVSYFKESLVELGKVTWPNRRQTLRLTAAVFIFSIALAGFMGGIDLGLNAAVKHVILK